MKYFSIAELCASATAARRGIDNTPNAQHVANLEALVLNVLDPLREAYGEPVTVTSGYRCPALNKAVGGAVTSHHLRGMAADLSVGGPAENRRLFELARTMKLKFTQLLWEKGTQEGPSWVHISYDPNNLKCEVKRIV